MALRIVIDGADDVKTYFPGQRITGKVVATFTKQQPVTVANINFRGKVETEYTEGRNGPAGNTHGPRRRARETIRLFEYDQELFRGPYDIMPQTLEWPFDFTIPTQCYHERVDNSDPGFIEDGWSETPSSFSWVDYAYTHSARARVKYKLTATIQSGGLFKNHDIEVPVTIQRISDVAAPRVKLTRHEILPSQCWSSSDLRQQSLTFRQKLKHLTSDDPELKTPCIAFRAL